MKYFVTFIGTESDYPIIDEIKKVEDEVFAVTAVTQADSSIDEFMKELDYCAGGRCKFHAISSISYNSSSDLLILFKHLIETAAEDQEIIADISFATQPQSMALLMFVNFAYQFFEGTTVAKIISREDGVTEDITNLFYLNSVMTIATHAKPKNPVEWFSQLIGK